MEYHLVRRKAVILRFILFSMNHPVLVQAHKAD